MREPVSKQRRETALRVARELLDPDYRRRHALGKDVPVVVALWNDPLEDVLRQVKDEGGRAVVTVRRPDGALGTLSLEQASLPDAAPRETTDDSLTAAPEATLGMLIDAFGRDEGSFVFELANSPLGEFSVALAATAG